MGYSELELCQGCGDYFPKSKLMKCKHCGVVLCPKCRRKHRCHSNNSGFFGLFHRKKETISQEEPTNTHQQPVANTHQQPVANNNTFQVDSNNACPPPNDTYLENDDIFEDISYNETQRKEEKTNTEISDSKKYPNKSKIDALRASEKRKYDRLYAAEVTRKIEYENECFRYERSSPEGSFESTALSMVRNCPDNVPIYILLKLLKKYNIPDIEKTILKELGRRAFILSSSQLMDIYSVNPIAAKNACFGKLGVKSSGELEELLKSYEIELDVLLSIKCGDDAKDFKKVLLLIQSLESSPSHNTPESSPSENSLPNEQDEETNPINLNLITDERLSELSHNPETMTSFERFTIETNSEYREKYYKFKNMKKDENIKKSEKKLDNCENSPKKWDLF